MAEGTNGSNGHGQPDLGSIPQELFDSMRALESTTNIILSRFGWARDNGVTFGGKRNEYTIFGYDQIITTVQFRDEYARGGIAGRVVDVMPDATWRGDPSFELIEDEDPEKSTQFEETWGALDQKHQIGSKLLRTDKLSRLSTYAILLIGAGGESLETELPKGNPDSLLYLMPFLGGGGPTNQNMRTIGVQAVDSDAMIASYDLDTASPRFGLPTSYNLRRTDYTAPGFLRPVHWTRVIHVAEGVLDNEVFGTPALERIWNLLADLRKVTGGGAEAFWLRANQGLHLDVDKDMALPDAQNAIAALKEQAEEYKHQLTRWLRTRGVKVETLGSDVANFSAPADAILTQIAGAKGIPKRILTGSEMGELASSQDRENFRDLIIGRQTQYAGPYIIRPLVDRLIAYGYLPTPKKGPNEYTIRWSHMQVMTEQEKTAGALAWAQTNQAYGSVVYTNDEIREKWSDKEPLTQDQLDKMAEEAQAKMEQQQQMMMAGQPPAEPGTKPGDKPARPQLVQKDQAGAQGGKPPQKPPTRAAQETELAQEQKFSSTQMELPASLTLDILRFGQTIPEELLSPEGGLETSPHVTVKYGIHTNDSEPVAQAVRGFQGPVRMKLGRMKLFKQTDYHVLYVSMESPDLVDLNHRIARAVEVTDTFPTYIPHITVAYLKPDGSQKYDRNAEFFGRREESSTLTFMGADGSQDTIPLEPRAASLDDKEREMLQVLKAAVASNNLPVIDRILGVAHDRVE